MKEMDIERDTEKIPLSNTTNPQGPTSLNHHKCLFVNLIQNKMEMNMD